MILADTSIWVQFFHTPASTEAQELAGLLRKNEVAITGVVLAEVLYGARNDEDFARLRSALEAPRYLDATEATWMKVGRISFTLRSRGQIVPLTDIAIAAVAIEHDVALFALDQHFQRIPGLKLHTVRTP